MLKGFFYGFGLMALFFVAIGTLAALHGWASSAYGQAGTDAFILGALCIFGGIFGAVLSKKA